MNKQIRDDDFNSFKVNIICNTVIFLLVSNCYFNLRPYFWSHCFNSLESKAEVWYVNEYIDCLLSLSVHIFKEIYILSCDQISCKAHVVGERLHKVFGLAGTLVAMAHGQHKAPIDIKKLKGERAITVRAIKVQAHRLYI